MEYLALLKDIFIGGERYKYILNGLSFSVGTTALAAIIGIALGIFIVYYNFHIFIHLNIVKIGKNLIHFQN